MLGALSGALGVMAGAFGAHALGEVLTARGAEVWDTAVLYHLVHSVALVLVAVLLAQASSIAPGEATVPGQAADSPAKVALPKSVRAGGLRLAGWAFAAGVLCFSGSLYGLALDGPRWLGPITPLGGLGFIAGWLALCFHAVKGART